MLQRDDLPDDREELAAVRITLPRSEDDAEASCPVSKQEILEHLAQEAPGGAESGSEEVIEFNLTFLRTATLDNASYWIWGFKDGNDADSYMLVGVWRNVPGERPAWTEGSRRPEETLLSYDEAFDLTPEQFIVAEHFDID